MNLREYAKLNDITLADAKKRTGLTHWKQEVADAPEDEGEALTVEKVFEEVLDIVEEVKPVEVAVVKAVAKVVEAVIDTVSKEDRLKSIKGLGTKSPYWSEFNG